MVNLLKLAITGEYTIFDFIIAARHVPGYSKEDAAYIEAQWFNSEGRPILTPKEEECSV